MVSRIENFISCLIISNFMKFLNKFLKFSLDFNRCSKPNYRKHIRPRGLGSPSKQRCPDSPMAGKSIVTPVSQTQSPGYSPLHNGTDLVSLAPLECDESDVQMVDLDLTPELEAMASLERTEEPAADSNPSVVVEAVVTGASGKTTFPNSFLQLVIEWSYMKQTAKYEDME